jgi:hypothetical protein
VSFDGEHHARAVWACVIRHRIDTPPKTEPPSASIGTGFVNAASRTGVVVAKNACGLAKFRPVNFHKLATGSALAAFPIGNKMVKKLRPLCALLIVG